MNDTIFPNVLGNLRLNASEPIKKCRIFEFYNKCGNQCEKSCKGVKKRCDSMCHPPACQCEEGYYRNRDGMCVRYDFCKISKPF